MNIETREGWVKVGDFWVDSAKVEGVYRKHGHLVLRMVSNKIKVPMAEGLDLTTVLDALDKARLAAATMVLKASQAVAEAFTTEFKKKMEAEGL